MSNLHPDMSGNPCDAPFVCEKCGHHFTDDAKLSGSFFSSATVLCSQECSMEYDYAIAERLQADLTAANARIAELEREAEQMQGLLQASQIASDRAMRERVTLEADNTRLRELLRECLAEMNGWQVSDYPLRDAVAKELGECK